MAEAVATYHDLHPEEDDVSTRTLPRSPAGQGARRRRSGVARGDEPALEEHNLTGQSIARILTNQKLVNEADLMWGMAQEMGLEFVDLDTAGVDLDGADLIPEATARHHNVLVIAIENGVPVVAASNPTDVFAMDDLRTIIGRNFITGGRHPVPDQRLHRPRLSTAGDAADVAMEASLGIDGGIQDDRRSSDIQAVVDDAPIVRYVNLLILQALNERASDIHVEPTADDLRIRYRIDGVLHDVSTGPQTIAAAVTTRLKVMADMNIAEHRVPQDGRISLNVGGQGHRPPDGDPPDHLRREDRHAGARQVERACSASPTSGSTPTCSTIYESLYTKPYGTILVTGPTGSGKTTTLYATLTALNSPEKNIITVEDPVELPLEGDQPGPAQRQGRPDLRRRPASRSCGRTPTSCWSARSATRRRR